jgi:hypothetical protein
MGQVSHRRKGRGDSVRGKLDTGVIPVNGPAQPSVYVYGEQRSYLGSEMTMASLSRIR